MSKREWRLYVEDVQESLGRIQEYVEGMTFEQFRGDNKTVDAVTRNFEIIGEASKFIPETVKEANPDVDWQGLVGLRNRIAHEYFVISVSVIWHIIEKELPAFEEQMKKILAAHRE